MIQTTKDLQQDHTILDIRISEKVKHFTTGVEVQGKKRQRIEEENEFQNENFLAEMNRKSQTLSVQQSF